MQKKVLRKGTLQLLCGQARPGARLSSWGFNMPLFCREFNARTSHQEAGKPIMVRIEVFEDKTFSFETKGTPTSILLKNLLKNKNKKVISSDDLNELVTLKIPDMNTENPDNVKKSILGSMRSAGIEIEE